MTDRRAYDAACYQARKARAARTCACGRLLAPTHRGTRCRPCSALVPTAAQAACRRMIGVRQARRTA